VVIDNLSVHKSRWVRELIEEKGCQLRLLPAYSPDLNPIEEAFSKVKSLLRKVRTLETLFEATTRALPAVTEEDARGFFSHCGYGPRAHPL
jgi:transposase